MPSRVVRRDRGAVRTAAAARNCPARATRAGIERIDVAVLARREQPPAEHARLRPRGKRIGKTERPGERSRGTSAAASPASSARWKRVFAAPVPQPFHAGAASDSASGDVVVQAPPGTRAVAAVTARPVRNSATPRRSVGDKRSPCTAILPLSSDAKTAAGSSPRIASSVGARASLAAT